MKKEIKTTMKVVKDYLVIGFFFLGRKFAVRTAYASLLLSAFLFLFEKIEPMEHSFSNQPMLELLFAIALFVPDLIMILISCFVFDIETALYSIEDRRKS